MICEGVGIINQPLKLMVCTDAGKKTFGGRRCVTGGIVVPGMPAWCIDVVRGHRHVDEDIDVQDAELGIMSLAAQQWCEMVVHLRPMHRCIVFELLMDSMKAHDLITGEADLAAAAVPARRRKMVQGEGPHRGNGEQTLAGCIARHQALNQIRSCSIEGDGGLAALWGCSTHKTNYVIELRTPGATVSVGEEC